MSPARKPSIKSAALLTALSVLVVIGLGIGGWLLVRSGAKASVAYSSIAVLPFTDLSPTKDHEYLAEGLSDELIDRLARIPELRVIARTSSFQFRGSGENPREVGRKLNVAAIVEGSIRKQGSLVRVTARLIQTVDGSRVWFDTYNDILDGQQEMARVISGVLRVKQPGPRGSITTNADAYGAYLEGRYFLRRSDGEKAAASFERAIQFDAPYAVAWAGLGAARLLLTNDEGHQRAREAIDRALVQNPNLAEGYAALGLLKMGDSDWVGADASFKRALALEPGNADVMRRCAVIAERLGRSDQAAMLESKVAELDPLNPAKRK